MIKEEDFKIMGINGYKTKKSVNDYVTGKSGDNRNLVAIRLRINKVEYLRNKYPAYYGKLKYGVSRINSEIEQRNILMQEINNLLGMVNLRGRVIIDLDEKTMRYEND